MLAAGLGVYIDSPAAEFPNRLRAALLLLILASVSAWLLVSCSPAPRAMGARRYELGCAWITIWVMVLLALQDPWYVAKLCGLDPASLLATCHNEQELVLILGMVLTACHFFVPFRWKLLLPIEVASIACYVVPALSLGSSTSLGGIFMDSFMLLLFALAAAAGKRDLETLERTSFVQVAQERTLRAELEHKLNHFETSGAPKGAGSISSATASDLGTTATGQIFDAFSNIGTSSSSAGQQLEQIVQLGYNEHWLIQPRFLHPQPERILGSGSFSVVVAARYHGSQVAVKLPRGLREVTRPQELLVWAQELRIFRRLHHPNIVFFYGACIDSETLEMALVIEHVRGVELRRAVHGPCCDLQELDFRCRLTHDVFCALSYLHSQEPAIIHGDVKDSNVLVDCTGTFCRAKLLDFGLSRLLTRRAQKLGGTLRWMAPEVILAEENSSAPSADVFSLGRLVYFVMTGLQPLHGISRVELLTQSRLGRCAELHWPSEGLLLKEAKQLCAECLAFEPAARPSVVDVQTTWRGLGMAAASMDVRAVISEIFPPPEPEIQLGAVLKALEAAPAETLQVRVGERPGSVEGGGASMDDGDRSALLYPQFEETPEAARMQTLLACVGGWNLPVRAGTCCRLHARLHEATAVARALCDQQVCPTGPPPATWQCPQCKVLAAVPVATAGGGHEAAKQCAHCDYTSEVVRAVRPLD